MEEFDVSVVGAGTAGVSAALRAADLGAKVCLIEKDHIGGRCFHKGLYPFQTVMHPLRLAHVARNSSQGKIEWNINGGPDLNRLFTEAREVGQAISDKWSKSLTQRGVHIIKGLGTLVSPQQIRVTSGEKETLIRTGRMILATGSKPKPLPTVPFDGTHVFSIDDIIHTQHLPESVVFMGGGPAACEFASLFNLLGSKVFVCIEQTRLLPDQDVEVTTALEGQLKKQKIKLLLNKKLESIFRAGERLDITLDGGVKFSASKMIFTSPRCGRTEELGTENLGIRMGESHEVLVNEFMESSTAGVFAAGGVTTGRAYSSGRSEEEGKVAAENALGKKKMFRPSWVPSIIHTNPEIATVGCFAGEAHHQGFRAVEGRCDYQQLDYALIHGEPDGLFKIVADRPTRKVIGGQIVAPRASEIIPLVLLAIKKGMTVGSLASLSCGWSTQLQGLKEAARSCARALKAQR